jgi:outer membrane receptor protein involved in Fe transport
MVAAQTASPLETPSGASDSGGSRAGDEDATQSTLATENLQEIMVTAQKYQQPAYEVPISLVVLSGQALQRRGVAGLEDLQFAVPGLSVQDTGSQRRIFIGGVTNTFGNGGLVAEYVDQADATSSPSLFSYNSLDLRTYDLERVEVLRGPQGTLYGEGALGGALHYVTNKPDVDSYHFAFQTEQLFTDDGGPSEHFFPVVNIPLITSLLAIRFAGEYSHDSGWIDQPSAARTSINDANLADTRIQALWTLAPKVSLSVMQIIHRNVYGLNVGENSSGNFTQVFGLQTAPVDHDNFNLSNVTATYDIAKGTQLTSSTTYYTDAVNITSLGATAQTAAPPKPPLNIIYPVNMYDFNSVSEELRVNHSTGPFRWSFGGFYKKVQSTNYPSTACEGQPLQFQSLQAVMLGVLCIPIGQAVFSKASSGFADVSYRFADRLTIGAGARVFSDMQTHDGVGAPQQRGTFRSVDPRYNVLYEASRSWNVYASAAKGFRSGGFNTLKVPRFGPETIWTYELGIKTRRPIRGISATADAYYSNYGNYQVQGLGPNFVAETANAGTVHIKGGEASANWGFGGGWVLGVSGQYVNARFATIDLLNTTHAVGDPVDQVPRYQIDTSVEDEFRWADRAWFVSMDYAQRAKEEFRERNLGPWFYSTSDNLYILKLAIGVQWTDHLSMGFKANNVLNDRGLVDPLSISGNAGRERPVTIGFYFQAQ